LEDEMDKKEWIMGSFLTRMALGLLFFFAGLNKFMGPGPEGFMNSILDQFSKTFLPPFSLKIYAYLLPFCEVGLGLFLIAGLYRKAVLFLTGLLLLSLGFGQILLGNHDTVASIFLYVFMAGWTLNQTNDRLTLDEYLTKK